MEPSRRSFHRHAENFVRALRSVPSLLLVFSQMFEQFSGNRARIQGLHRLLENKKMWCARVGLTIRRQEWRDVHRVFPFKRRILPLLKSFRSAASTDWRRLQERQTALSKDLHQSQYAEHNQVFDSILCAFVQLRARQEEQSSDDEIHAFWLFGRRDRCTLL